MFRLIGKASASIKRLIKGLPFFKEVPQDAARLTQLPPTYKPHRLLPAVAIAGALLTFSAGGMIVAKQNLEVPSLCIISLQKDVIENRVQVTQYPANAPCEDTYNVKQLLDKGKRLGYYAGVFDGHGGWQMAEYAKKNLHVYVQEELSKIYNSKRAATEEDYKKAIETAFDRVEAEFLKFSKEAFQKGFPSAAYVGACALVTVVAGNKLYVASAGDCKAGTFCFCISWDSTYQGNGGKLRRNQNKQKIQCKQEIGAAKAGQRISFRARCRYLCNFFLNQSVYRKGSKLATLRYFDLSRIKKIQGNLMPTRALGDYRLKHKEFNTHEFVGTRGYRRELRDYHGPYITHKPDIQTHTLQPNDKFLVIATDGLWDEMDLDEVARVFALNKAHPNKLSEKQVSRSEQNRLFQETIKKVSKRTGLTEEDILQGRFPVRRRTVHDDITILVVNLAEQAQPSHLHCDIKVDCLHSIIPIILIIKARTYLKK
eukprot:TRINITY_DN6303_c0_g1_i3.p1 TRINITY_DN6303_c0_g1~~TRINITY_DN6303_c0_g1_i3.p1  ORF type:complete len:484 (-),score=12.11 TRINITY_DN6303_c0_g1_i3:1018-2469(-)